MSKVLFPLWTNIPLNGLGYDEGSEVIANVNRTRSWEHEWNAVFDTKQADNETYTAWQKRMVDAQYALLAPMIKYVVLKMNGNEHIVGDGNTKNPQTITIEELQFIDEQLDGRVMNFIATETNERNAARTTNASAPFRAERLRVLTGGRKAETPSTNGSDKPIVTNENAE